MVIRDLTISTPLSSRAGTGGRCHECGGALFVGCMVSNVGRLVSQSSFSRGLASGAEFLSQIASMGFPPGIEVVSQVSIGRPYHPWQGYVVQGTSSTGATTFGVVAHPGALYANGELGASLSGP